MEKMGAAQRRAKGKMYLDTYAAMWLLPELRNLVIDYWVWNSAQVPVTPYLSTPNNFALAEVVTPTLEVWDKVSWRTAIITERKPKENPDGEMLVHIHYLNWGIWWDDWLNESIDSWRLAELGTFSSRLFAGAQIGVKCDGNCFTKEQHLELQAAYTKGDGREYVLGEVTFCTDTYLRITLSHPVPTRPFGCYEYSASTTDIVVATEYRGWCIGAREEPIVVIPVFF